MNDIFQYDVFLSYNSQDDGFVKELAGRLTDQAGLRVWLDDWELIPGTARQEETEKALEQSRTFAVCLGRAGLGSWQNEEVRVALGSRVADQNRRVIPVLLPGSDPQRVGTLPQFLSRLSWVDFRAGLEDMFALRRLMAGIMGIAPSRVVGTPSPSNRMVQGPRFFLCFVPSDQALAKRLVGDLQRHIISPLAVECDLRAAVQAPDTLARTLSVSDFCVVLVSGATDQDPILEKDWPARLAATVDGRRAFLFLFRVDNSVPPPVLSARTCLDASSDWESAVNELVAVWRRDVATKQQGVSVMPAPGLANNVDSTVIGIYVFNRDLNVQHFMLVKPSLSGRQLLASVRTALALPPEVSALGGQVGLRFSYVLAFNNTPLAEDALLLQAGVADGVNVDLVVHVQSFGPGSTDLSSQVTFRPGQSDGQTPGRLSPQLAQKLLAQAFGHLLPGTGI